MQATRYSILFVCAIALPSFGSACASLVGADFDHDGTASSNDAGNGSDGAGATGDEPNEPSETGSDQSVGDAASRIALGTVVLFGGEQTTGVLGDTWTFDGTRWTSITPTTSPLPRSHAKMSALGRNVVLFGGLDANSQALNDTWMFDGATWRIIPVVHTPQFVSEIGMASLGNKVVLYDGVSTWSFDGTDWTLLQISSPEPARSSAAMATWGDNIYLVGGDVWLTDTWTFDGTAWTKIAAETDSGTAGGAIGVLQNWLVVTTGCHEGQVEPSTCYFDHTKWVCVQFPVQGTAPWGCDTPMFEIDGRLILFEIVPTLDAGPGLGAWAFSRSTTKWSTVSFPGAPSLRSAHAVAYVK